MTADKNHINGFRAALDWQPRRPSIPTFGTYAAWSEDQQADFDEARTNFMLDGLRISLPHVNDAIRETNTLAVMANSGKGVNWDCHGHTFFMPVRNRVAGMPCSKCARGITVGQRGKPIRPEILASWDYGNNPGVDPSTLYRKSPYVAWWRCEEGHRWQCAVASRARGTGCPTCHRQKRSAPIRGVTDQRRHTCTSPLNGPAMSPDVGPRPLPQA